MDLFEKLPDHQRSPPGLERTLWRRLPAVLFWGTALPLGLAALHVWAASPADEAAAMLLGYKAIGLVVLHWTLVITMGFGCVIVMLMKGPAYVADAYPLHEHDPLPPLR
jgi:hypothetical protein